MHIRNLVATTALALLATTTFAQAAVVTKPGPVITGSGPTTTGINRDSTSPGDPYFPEISVGNVGERTPMPRIPCFVDLDENGLPQVHYTNQSGIDYPKGTVLQITFSNGEVGTYIYSTGGFYAGSDWVQHIPTAWMPPLTCSVEVVVAEDVPH